MTGVTAYYNEIDPYAAQWLRNLIAAGHIAPGDVDERSIIDVQPDDLRGYTQCHWFAGLGGWSLALRLAGWPDDKPVWTGSCPCQPFSVAGNGDGTDDPRHLWPVWFRLIRECRPAVVYGEQVEGAVRHGWLDLVCGDMEGEGYAIGATVLGAHSVGAPHIRQRLWFVAKRLADAEGERWHRSSDTPWKAGRAGSEICGATGGLADATAGGWREERQDAGRRAIGDHEEGRAAGYVPSGDAGRPDPLDGFWREADWLYCRDGKWRPVEPGLKPLVARLSPGMGSVCTGEDSPFRVITDPKTGKSIGQEPWRIGMLRGYGNAINPWVAAAFIESVAP